MIYIFAQVKDKDTSLFSFIVFQGKIAKCYNQIDATMAFCTCDFGLALENCILQSLQPKSGTLTSNPFSNTEIY